jgi:hypothetical protein
VPVRANELDDELTEEEVSVWVGMVNTRRNLTIAQKIMVASKEHSKPDSKSLSVISKAWGISSRILVMANYVSKARPEFVEPLFNGKTVEIVDAKGNQTQTNKISAIHAFIKREEEDVTEESSYGWTADSHINTQLGKDWFYEFISINGIKNVDVMVELAHRANDKFKDGNP